MTVVGDAAIVIAGASGRSLVAASSNGANSFMGSLLKSTLGLLSAAIQPIQFPTPEMAGHGLQTEASCLPTAEHYKTRLCINGASGMKFVSGP